jgi:hypothetical protein
MLFLYKPAGWVRLLFVGRFLAAVARPAPRSGGARKSENSKYEARNKLKISITEIQNHSSATFFFCFEHLNFDIVSYFGIRNSCLSTLFWGDT